MEQLTKKVDSLCRAVFGDDEDRKSNPGILAELVRMDIEHKQTNALLSEIRDGIKKVVWLVVSAVLVGVLSLILKGGV